MNILDRVMYRIMSSRTSALVSCGILVLLVASLVALATYVDHRDKANFLSECRAKGGRIAETLGGDTACWHQ